MVTGWMHEVAASRNSATCMYMHVRTACDSVHVCMCVRRRTTWASSCAVTPLALASSSSVLPRSACPHCWRRTRSLAASSSATWRFSCSCRDASHGIPSRTTWHMARGAWHMAHGTWNMHMHMHMQLLSCSSSNAPTPTHSTSSVCARLVACSGLGAWWCEHGMCMACAWQVQGTQGRCRAGAGQVQGRCIDTNCMGYEMLGYRCLMEARGAAPRCY